MWSRRSTAHRPKWSRTWPIRRIWDLKKLRNGARLCTVRQDGQLHRSDGKGGRPGIRALHCPVRHPQQPAPADPASRCQGPWPVERPLGSANERRRRLRERLSPQRSIAAATRASCSYRREEESKSPQWLEGVAGANAHRCPEADTCSCFSTTRQTKQHPTVPPGRTTHGNQSAHP